MNTSYNGWKNYETWCVQLWLHNTESSYRLWSERAERLTRDERKVIAKLADELSEALNDTPLLSDCTVYADLLTTALDRVDWTAIAASLIPDMATSEDAEPASCPSATPCFPLGRIHCTPAVLLAVGRPEIDAALVRHVHGDWGLVGPEDAQENRAAAKDGFRILSVYENSAQTRFWIITEADRSITTVLLPEEY